MGVREVLSGDDPGGKKFSAIYVLFFVSLQFVITYIKMKKINTIICAAMFLTLLASCGGKHQFTINGTVGGNHLDGQTVYLFNYSDPKSPTDSATVADGGFTFSGEVAEPWIAIVGTQGFGQTLIVEPGTIAVAPDSVGGTQLNGRLMTYIKGMDISDLQGEMETYYMMYYSAPDATQRAEAERLYDSVEAIANARMLDASWASYNDNRDNIVGAMAMEGIARLGDMPYAEFDSILSDASPVVKAYKPVSDKLAQLKAIDETSAGKHYTDIQGVDGKLSDLIDGHLALVDFYASWCGPCRNEIRDNLVPLWKKYQKKGLVIVGLNVWERGDAEARKAAHEKVMADLGITYPQLVDSTRTATTTYGVIGIPQIMLIGPDGTILARDLRGAAIEEAIVKALDK